MILNLRTIVVERESWRMQADAEFSEGVHLVTGAVGSGKSSLALLLAGSVIPVRGHIEMEGIASVQMGMQFPEHQVTATTVEGEILSWGLDPQEILRATALSDRAGANPLLLSRGELRRLELACVLGTDPDLLLLDEPFSSLDCREKTMLCRRLEGRCHGITIIFSHEPWHLPRIDHLWEMVSGTLQYHGKMPDAVRRWAAAPPLFRRRLSEMTGDAREEVTAERCRTHGSGSLQP